MELHPALRDEVVDLLREDLRRRDADAPLAPPPPTRPASRARSPVAWAKQATKQGVRKAIAWYVDPTAADAAERAATFVAGRLAAEVDELSRRFERTPEDDARFVAINLELLKGELRALQATLDEIGMAIAPATGLAGATARMAELRERVNALERRTRGGAAGPSAGAAAPAPAAARASGVASGAGGGSDRFDYVGFERRFRGDTADVVAIQRQRYLELLRGRGPVLDVGCGRGELLSVLAAEGIDALGVDLEADSVAQAVEAGLDVHRGDALEFLRARPEGSFGAVVSFHVVEHLQLEELVELLELSVSRLRPGGLFVAETPNPSSLIVLGNSYVLDPTHVRPLHPSLMAFLCETAGFRDVRLEFYAPAEAYRLPLIGTPSSELAVVNEAFSRLNEVLFGPQEYAVLAITAPPATVTQPPGRG